MTSSKNGFAKTEKESLANPGARFASNFSRLVADVDRLMLDVHGTNKGNGHANKSRLNGNGHLHEQARSFFNSNFAPLLTKGLDPLWELVVSVSGARELSSISDAVRKYCSAALHSPSGLIFLAKGNGLVPAYQWQANNLVRKPPREAPIASGPAFQVLRSGKPTFCCAGKANFRGGEH